MIVDINNNWYHTVTIGTQVWMVENLRVTRFNDGTELTWPSKAEWGSIVVPQYGFYNFDIKNKDVYGVLYNYCAVASGKLAPKGWHIPSDQEWQILIDYLGGENVAGGKIKDTGTIESDNGAWVAPNQDATNESGLKSLPGGYIESDGKSYAMGTYCNFWSSTWYSDDHAWYWYISSKTPKALGNNWSKKAGFSVRCIKD